MDPRLLDYYNRELAYMREMGREFADQHPKIAARLGMHGLQVADPYVERLLEGFAFVAARIHLKMDAQFPRFSQRLLELIYPHYLTPTPAMGIVRLNPKTSDGGLTAPFPVPRHTLIHAPLVPGQTTACQFRTAHAVELLPLALTRAWVQGHARDVPTPQGHATPASSLHLQLETTGGREIGAIGFDALPIYLAGTAERALHLLELIAARLIGCTLNWVHHGKPHTIWLPPQHISTLGFAEDESLIPYRNTSFSGYRLLHEYFACPERFRFFRLNRLGEHLRHIKATGLEIALYFDRVASALEKVVTAADFALFTTPVINLFHKRGDRTSISLAHFEHHLLADRSRPLDYEIFSISRIHGYRSDNTEQQVFRPLYETLGAAGTHAGQADDTAQAWFSMRREPRKPSETARRNGMRSGYIGSEVFVQLVDRQDAPWSGSLDRVAPDMLCTNRDLPLLLNSTGAQRLHLDVSVPVERAEFITPITRPTPAIAEQHITWQLLSHLQLNFHTLTDASPADGAKVMRELLHLYTRLGGHTGAHSVARHAQAITSMRLAPMYVRIPQPGPIVFGRGVEIEMEIDEDSFAGSSPWLFGSILEHFLARHVGINTATRLALRSIQHGEFARWPARSGKRPII